MPSTLVRFGEFELDPGKYELLREGQPVKLERLPMELLILLVESRGTLVTREMIIEHLWGKDVYRETERGINTAINKLRSVLCDDPRQPRYLHTIIGKGYRFVHCRSTDRHQRRTASAASGNFHCRQAGFQFGTAPRRLRTIYSGHGPVGRSRCRTSHDSASIAGATNSCRE